MTTDRAQSRWNGWGWTPRQGGLAERQWQGLARRLGMPALLATPACPPEEIRLPAPRLSSAVVARLAGIVGADGVKQDDAARALHAAGHYDAILQLRAGDGAAAPDAIVCPRNEEDVLAILSLAAAEKIAVRPFGGEAGPGFTGTLDLDLSAMAALVSLDRMSGIARFGAGVTGPALAEALSARGLTFGSLPEGLEFGSLGGWIAAPDAGREVMSRLGGLRLATPQGLMEVAPDGKLAPMVLGSAGRLGVITEASLRVRPRLLVHHASFLFADFAAGLTALREAARLGIAHLHLHLADAEATDLRHLLEDPGVIDRLKWAWHARRVGAHPARLVAAFPDMRALRAFTAIAGKLDAVALGTGRIAQRFRGPGLRDILLDRGVGMESFQAMARWSDLPRLYAATRAALDRAMRAEAPVPGARGLVLADAGPVWTDGAALSFTAIFARRLDDESAQTRAIRQAGLAAIKAYGGGRERALEAAALESVRATLDPAGILNTPT